MTSVDVVLTYSATTTNPQLNMDNVPGYTFDDGGPNPCGDGWFPIDGQLLGNSYRASRFAEHVCPVLSVRRRAGARLDTSVGMARTAG